MQQGLGSTFLNTREHNNVGTLSVSANSRDDEWRNKDRQEN